MVILNCSCNILAHLHGKVGHRREAEIFFTGSIDYGSGQDMLTVGFDAGSQAQEIVRRIRRRMADYLDDRRLALSDRACLVYDKRVDF